MASSNISYSNLRAEMGRYKISLQDIADKIGMNRDTLGRKLSGKAPIALDEAFMIADVFPSNNALTYLFFEARNTTTDKAG